MNETEQLTNKKWCGNQQKKLHEGNNKNKKNEKLFTKKRTPKKNN